MANLIVTVYREISAGGEFDYPAGQAVNILCSQATSLGQLTIDIPGFASFNNGGAQNEQVLVEVVKYQDKTLYIQPGSTNVNALCQAAQYPYVSTPAYITAQGADGRVGHISWADLVALLPSGSQVQSDFGQTNPASVAFIQNKPTVVSYFTNDAGYISPTGGTITGALLVPTPTSPTQAVNKQYVDNAIIGLQQKNSPIAATTTALPSNTYNNGAGTLTATANGALPAIDGITVIVGQYVLVQNEATSSHNGLYLVTQSSGGTPYILTRSTDMAASNQFNGTYVVVQTGATFGGSFLIFTYVAGFTLGTSPIAWTKANNSYIPGAGIVFTGSTISVDTTVVSTTTNVLTLTNKTFTNPKLTGFTNNSILYYNNAIVQDNANLGYDGTTVYLSANNNWVAPTYAAPSVQIGLSYGAAKLGTSAAVSGTTSGAYANAQWWSNNGKFYILSTATPANTANIVYLSSAGGNIGVGFPSNGTIHGASAITCSGSGSPITMGINLYGAAGDKIAIATTPSAQSTGSVTVLPRLTFGVGADNVLVWAQNASCFLVGAAGANAAAIMQINSTSQGFAMPRMSTVQKNAIASPFEGLAVWDLTGHYVSYYNGFAWT